MSSDLHSDLRAPILLLAMPQVLDPNFRQSVVLLTQHSEEGSLGFIVNRPLDARVADILEELSIPWGGTDITVAYFGGPVQPQLGTVLYACGEGGADLGEGSVEIHPGLALTHHVGDLQALAAAPPERFRLVLGYAGWGAGQLMDEILRNDWLMAPANDELIFAARADEAWRGALLSVGVDPSALPSWTAAGHGEDAN